MTWKYEQELDEEAEETRPATEKKKWPPFVMEKTVVKNRSQVSDTTTILKDVQVLVLLFSSYSIDNYEEYIGINRLYQKCKERAAGAPRLEVIYVPLDRDILEFTMALDSCHSNWWSFIPSDKVVPMLVHNYGIVEVPTVLVVRVMDGKVVSRRPRDLPHLNAWTLLNDIPTRARQ
ncbi:hypothetical protein AAG570_010955 [Ranatra chinensis]|uniref:Thioredoxin-like fold domain-containing protein n=1 Tax=Ranatra chinensis TaxID=642074 RepID=A0ABD0YVG4_9HEMI